MTGSRPSANRYVIRTWLTLPRGEYLFVRSLDRFFPWGSVKEIKFKFTEEL